MKLAFCLESAFQASQVNMGMTYMTRAAHFTSRTIQKPDSLLDLYMYYDGDHWADIVNPPSINQDVWSTYFAIRAGYGAMICPSISFYTTPPDDWITLLGQRRRWYSGTVLAAYQWLDPFSTPRNFFTLDRLRFLMWCMVVPGVIFYLWMGLGLLAYNVAFTITNFYCDLKGIDETDQGYQHPELLQIHEGTLCVFWAVTLLWALGMVDREPKDMNTYAHIFIYGMIGVTVGIYGIGIYATYQSTQVHDQWMAKYAPYALPYYGEQPSDALQQYLLGAFLYPLIPHLFINGVFYWPTLTMGYITQLFTGSALFNVSMPQVHTLFWIYAFGSLDSGSWGVRAGAEGEAVSGFSNKYEEQKKWRKIKKWMFFSVYLSLNIFISFAFTRIPNFSYYWWTPMMYIGEFFAFLGFTANWGLYVLALALLYNSLDCLFTAENNFPEYAQKAQECKAMLAEGGGGSSQGGTVCTRDAGSCERGYRDHGRVRKCCMSECCLYGGGRKWTTHTV